MASENESIEKSREFFKPIDGESGQETTEVESLCVNCGDNGITKLLFVIIPFYKEVIISSFDCSHCNFQNNEIQSAGELQLQGIEFSLQVADLRDLDRQVVKSDYASLTIPQLDFEIPSGSQKGEITNVEGILQRVVQGLEQDQPRRKIEHIEDYEKIEDFIKRINKCKNAEEPFTLRIRDISGNSFISPRPSTLLGHRDDRLHITRFNRTKEENHTIGYYPELAEELAAESNAERKEGEEEDEEVDFQDEVLTFPTNCPKCGVHCLTKMKVTKIPYFKEVVIMATDCDECGYRTNEVKSGSGIELKGRTISLLITSVDDLSRDVLKSETCSIEIPELELEFGAGLLGGKFSTLEGLFNEVKAQLTNDNPLMSGDSADSDTKRKMDEFCLKFDRLIACEVPFNVILNDPAGNSYLQNIYAPADDPNMNVEEYERTFAQNEDLGLNDMKVDGAIEEEEEEDLGNSNSTPVTTTTSNTTKD